VECEGDELVGEFRKEQAKLMDANCAVDVRYNFLLKFTEYQDFWQLIDNSINSLVAK